MNKKSNTKSEIYWDNLAEAWKSAGHPERLAILHLMCNYGSEQIMVKTIYVTLHLEQSITSRHLSIMRKGGLLKREIKAGKIFYHLNKENEVVQGIRTIFSQRR